MSRLTKTQERICESYKEENANLYPYQLRENLEKKFKEREGFLSDIKRIEAEIEALFQLLEENGENPREEANFDLDLPDERDF